MLEALIDKITSEYLIEIKKSDADIEAVRWQLLFYLKVLKDKGIIRKGKIEEIEKNKSNRKIMYEELNEEKEKELEKMVKCIEELVKLPYIPKASFDSKCKKCAYYEYCYI